MLELRIIAGAQAITPFDLPALLGRKGAARELGDTIDALIAFMDDLDGDPDLEETDAEDSFAPSLRALAFAHGAGCSISDAGGGDIVDQPHDEEEDRCAAGDDMIEAGPILDRGNWLAGNRHVRDFAIGSEDDAEGEYPTIPQYQVDQRQLPLPEGYQEANDRGYTP